MAGNSLLALKTKENSELKPVLIRELVQEAVELAGVYLEGKEIELQVETDDITAMADYDKLLGVIINLVKNASEAFDSETLQNGKYIKIKAEKTKILSISLFPIMHQE